MLLPDRVESVAVLSVGELEGTLLPDLGAHEARLAIRNVRIRYLFMDFHYLVLQI
jgi:hypothetical protein